MGSSYWKYLTLENLTENFDSMRIPVKEADRKKGSYPYYGASGIIDMVDKYIFDGNYLLVAEDGENLRSRKTPIAFIASGRFWVNNHAHIIRGNEKADTHFLMYSLQNMDIGGYLTGSTIPKLTQDNLNRIQIFAPRLHEQRAIVELLGSLDNKIELNRRMNTTLEAIASTLFKEWFVDFNFPGKTGEMVDVGGEQQFSHTGMIPRGWDVHKLGNDPVFIIDGDRGTNYPKQEDFLNNGHCLFLNTKNVTEYGFDFTNCKFISKDKDESLNKGKLIRNDIVLTTRGTVGNIAYYDDFIQFDSIRINSGMVIFRCNNSCYPFFLYLFLKGNYFKDQVQTLISGSAQPQLPIKDIRRIEIVIPNTRVMNDFRLLLMPIEHKIALNNQENAALITIRDTLLPKLISGEVRVKTSGNS